MFIRWRISIGNRSTESTMWMTLLLAMISAMIIVVYPAKDSTVTFMLSNAIFLAMLIHIRISIVNQNTVSTI